MGIYRASYIVRLLVSISAVGFFFCALGSVGCRTGSQPVNIHIQKSVQPLSFAAGEIAKALEARNYQVQVSEPPGTGWSIVLGLQKELSADFPSMAKTQLREGGYILNVDRWKKRIIAAGAEPRGAMYGALEIAEQIELGAALPALQSKTENPFHEVRIFKMNIPFGGGYIVDRKEKEIEWFYDQSYWDAFFTTLAKDRYNIITLWSSHPYHMMVEIPGFPEASEGIPKEKLQKNREAFKYIFASAARHGLESYLISWNIHYAPGFAKKHKLKAFGGEDNETVRRYMRAAIKAVLDAYPGLTGIGTCPGEAMHMTDEEKEQWLLDTYAQAIIESRGPQRFLHRYWGVREPQVTQKVFAANYPGQTYITLKYNGEHMYSDPAFHYVDMRWLEQEPRSYRIVWHLRNDDYYILPWGNADFARAMMHHCKADYSAGYLTGSECEIPGTDLMYTSDVQARIPWKYIFEKQWYRYMLWGKLGYNPELNDSYFEKHFVKRYGPKNGKILFAAQQAAGTLLPLTTGYHWNYMNFDWYPEGCSGTYQHNTGRAGRGKDRDFREPGPFHNVREFIFNYVIDDKKYISIPEYVGYRLTGLEKGADDKRLGPLEVADKLESNANLCLDQLKKLKITDENSWTAHYRTDLTMLATLGLYYAEKFRGAAYLAVYMGLADQAAQQQAIKHLERAKQHWDALCTIADNRYLKIPLFAVPDEGDGFHWSIYRDDVAEDIEIARSAKPEPRQEHTWEIIGPFPYAGRKAKDFEANYLSTRQIPPDATRCQAPIVQIKTDEPLLKKWWDMANERGRFLNLRRLFPKQKGGSAYAELKLAPSNRHWARLSVDVGNVTAVWYNGKEIYSAPHRRTTSELREGFMIPINAEANTLLLRIDGPPGEPLDWGHSYRLEYLDTFSAEIAEKKGDSLTLALKNNLKGTTLKNLKVKAHCWTQGWAVSPESEIFDLSDSKSMAYAVSASADADDWTGLTLTMDYEGEIQTLRPTLILPKINVQQTDNPGDGIVSSGRIGGREAYASDVRHGQCFIYYDVKDKVMRNINADVKLTVEYYSPGKPDQHIIVQYDAQKSKDVPHSEYKEIKVPMSATQGWHEQVIILTGARFNNHQNSSTDFRLSSEDDIYVRRVQVEKPE